MFRNTSLPCRFKHEKIKALAAGITIARCSSGVVLTGSKTMSAKGIIGSMVSKLEKKQK